MIQKVNVSHQKHLAYTKEGNQYQKSSKGKYIGLGVGLGCGVARNFDSIINNKDIIQQLNSTSDSLKATIAEYIRQVGTAIKSNENEVNKAVREILNDKKFDKVLKSMPRIVLYSIIALSIALFALSGFILGKITDVVINKARAKKADKSANKIDNTQQVQTTNLINKQTPSRSGFAAFQNATK